jgi:RHS repeat-associated protein
MEYFEDGGDATAQLAWEPPGEALEIVPSSALTPASPPTPPTATPSNTPTDTATPTETATQAVETDTPTLTLTPVDTATPTETETPTDSPTPTWTSTATPVPGPIEQQRTITYTYDGLLRLIGAAEAPGTEYAYAYDLAGNRTEQWVNSEQTEARSFNAANQVVGWQYDAAGNLLNDTTTTYTYDALDRVTTSSIVGLVISNAYNGDGVLVAQSRDSITTRFTQDIIAPLHKILHSGGTNYIYGHERLAARTGSSTVWYTADALGSLRQTTDSGNDPLGYLNYDPWGVPQGSLISPFGFSSELQESSGLTYLRARWYSPVNGTFTGYRWETSESNDRRPYSHHPYAYALGDPIRYIDPTGKCVTGVVVDTLVCGGLLLAGVMLASAGVIAADPAMREAAEDVGQRSTQAIQNIAADASRGAQYVNSTLVDWFPNNESCSISTGGASSTTQLANTITNEEVDEAIKTAEAELVTVSTQPRDQLKFLYRGKDYTNIFNKSFWLWTTESLSYALAYADMDMVNPPKDRAIAIYAIRKSDFQLLRASGNILTKYDAERRVAKGLEPIALNQEKSLEWALDPVAQAVTFGPIVIRFPRGYTPK